MLSELKDCEFDTDDMKASSASLLLDQKRILFAYYYLTCAVKSSYVLVLMLD